VAPQTLDPSILHPAEAPAAISSKNAPKPRCGTPRAPPHGGGGGYVLRGAQKKEANVTARFGNPFRLDFGAQSGHQIYPRTLPRRSCSPVPVACCFWTRFLLILNTRNLRNRAPAYTGARFLQIDASRLRHQKNIPKWLQTLAQEPSKKLNIKIKTMFVSTLSLKQLLDDFWTQKGTPNDPQNPSKI
jgi:hypothetical protein